MYKVLYYGSALIGWYILAGMTASFSDGIKHTVESGISMEYIRVMVFISSPGLVFPFLLCFSAPWILHDKKGKDFGALLWWTAVGLLASVIAPLVLLSTWFFVISFIYGLVFG